MGLNNFQDILWSFAIDLKPWLKRIEHAIHDEAMEHAESGFKCKSDKSDCTKDEIEKDLTEGEVRYMSRRAELKSEVVGWSIRHLIKKYIDAGIFNCFL